MNDLVHKERNKQHLKLKRPQGTDPNPSLQRRGPCGIDDEREKCHGVQINLISVLRSSPAFETVYKELKGTGVRIRPNKKLSIRPTASADARGAGNYNPITGIIELPVSIYTSQRPVRSSSALKLIAHELYHAWQFRKLHKISSGGGPQERAEIIARSVHKMGRDKYIKSWLNMEKKAERFGIKVALQALKNDHSLLRIYRKSIGPITKSEFAKWSFSTWWHSNEPLYQRNAEISYVQWTYRYAESDYAPEFNKEALKAWLKRNPKLR